MRPPTSTTSNVLSNRPGQDMPGPKVLRTVSDLPTTLLGGGGGQDGGGDGVGGSVTWAVAARARGTQ
jgi:hypothetical protein